MKRTGGSVRQTTLRGIFFGAIISLIWFGLYYVVWAFLNGTKVEWTLSVISDPFMLELPQRLEILISRGFFEGIIPFLRFIILLSLFVFIYALFGGAMGLLIGIKRYFFPKNVPPPTSIEVSIARPSRSILWPALLGSILGMLVTLIWFVLYTMAWMNLPGGTVERTLSEVSRPLAWTGYRIVYLLNHLGLLYHETGNRWILNFYPLFVLPGVFFGGVLGLIIGTTRKVAGKDAEDDQLCV